MKRTRGGIIVPDSISVDEPEIPEAKQEQGLYAQNAAGHYYQLFPSRIHPLGDMPAEPRSHALWYFLVIATQCVQTVEKDVLYEGSGETEAARTHKLFRGIATTTCGLYEVTLDEMFAQPLVRSALKEIRKLGGDLDEKILGWVLSGGLDTWTPVVSDYWFNNNE